MKLNLGCRDRPIPGFKGMDCDPHPDVDFVGDISDLSRFKDEEAEEIYASHCLEHFPHTRTREIITEWYRVLRMGGKLYIAVPDFGACLGIYSSEGMTEWLVNFLWGGQEYKTAFHYIGFDEDSLTRLLLLSGFRSVERHDRFNMTETPDCSDLCIKKTINGEPHILPMSLNLVATK